MADAPASPVRRLADAVALLESGLPPSAAWSLAGIEVDARGAPRLEGADSVTTGALAASAWLAHDGGMPLAGVLRRVLAVLHSREEAADARQAALAGPRMSARVLAWLPVAGLGLAAALDPGALRLIALTPFGWVLLVLAAALTWGGRRWTRTLLMRADPPVDEIPAPLLLALVDAVLAAGTDVAGAATRVGEAMGGDTGECLVAVGRRLASGATWDDAWSGADARAQDVRRALRAAYHAGASAAPALAAAIDDAQREERRAGQKAAAELAVTLSLPLTLCLLPAFILVGVVPLIAAVVASVDLGSLS